MRVFKRLERIAACARKSGSHRPQLALVLAASLVASSGCISRAPAETVTGDYLSARLAAQQNAISAAADAYAEAASIATGEPDLRNRAFFYQLAAGDFDAAALSAKTIIETGAPDPDGLAKTVIGVDALRRGDLQTARAAFSDGIEAPYLKSAAYLSDVWIEDALAGPAAAATKMTQASDDIFRGFNPLHKAMLAEKAGQIEAASAAYQVALLGLGGPVGRAAYGPFLERSGNIDDARDFYELLSRDAGAPRRMAEAGLARLQSGRPSKLYAAVDARTGAAIAFYSFAGAILDQTVGERARAEEAGFAIGAPRYNLPLGLAQIAVALDPTLYEAHSLIGQIFNVYGDFDAAAAILEAIPPRSPLYEQSRIFIARGLAERGDEAGAVRLLDQAVRRDPGALEARLTLANLHAARGDHNKAIAVATTIIDGLGDEPEEDAWRYFVTRGGSFVQSGAWEKGERDLKRAVEIAPEEATALNYLGYSWAERGENLEQAFAMIKKAVALAPESGAIIDSLGWAHYQRGDYLEALGHLERAASLEPDDPTISDHLGDLYWRLDRKIEARYQWRRALDMSPSAKLETRLREKLDAGLPAETADE